MGYVKSHCRPKDPTTGGRVAGGRCKMGKKGAKNLKKKTGRALVKGHQNPKGSGYAKAYYSTEKVKASGAKHTKFH